MLGIMGLVVGAAGCEGAVEPAAGHEVGHALYVDHCAACHGASGRGDGAMAGGLPVAPADLTRIAARHDGVFPWSDVIAKIHGYAGRSGVMPEFGTVLTGPRVMWTDEAGHAVETPRALLDIAH